MIEFLSRKYPTKYHFLYILVKEITIVVIIDKQNILFAKIDKQNIIV